MDSNYVDRRKGACLSEEDVEMIAERAAEKAVDKIVGDVYRNIGKSLVSKALWMIGAITMGFGMYLNSKGLIK